MTFPQGTRLGPYEMLAPIGAGGMGEVYRARDTRLHRDVAVKVLPSEFAEHADRLQRFELEARAAAALNHPNVLAVFDVGVDGGVPYVVSELLEGHTLAHMLAERGALPARTAVDIAEQVAAGMSAAHAKGIVHRDLKPSNIFITGDGRAKILDFGLAKLVAPAGGTAATTGVPATTETTPGMVLGTVGYMSPEQVRGEPADHRSDIFSFGAVFYEMLSGGRAFQGDAAVEVMTAILKEDPPPLPAGTVSLPLDRVVHRCLEKVPAQRFQSAADIAFALDALSLSISTPAVGSIALPKTGGRRVLMALGIAAALVIAAFGAARLASPGTALWDFEAVTFDRWPVTNARFMPDGRTIVYSAATKGYTPELFIISPGVEAPQPLGVGNAQLLSISSKGELALIVNTAHIGQRLYSGTLARMTLGSSPRAVADDVREADWAPDGESMAVVHDLGNGRDRLEYPAGTSLYEASGYLSDPRVSPDGSRVAFFEHQWRFDDRGWVKVVDRAGAVTTLAGEWWGLQGLAWAPDGSTLLFSGSDAGGKLMQPMTVAASGQGAVTPAFGVPGRFIVYDVSRDGRWLATREDLSLSVRAVVPGQAGERDLSWLGTGARGLSRDGAWLLMVDVGVRGGRDYGVVLRKTDGSQAIRLGAGSPQRLSPDGRWAAAIIATPPEVVLYPTGTGEAQRLPAGPIERFISAEWFPDGRELLVCGSEPARAPRCYRQDVSGSPLAPVTPEGVLASLAPDGHTLLATLQDGTFQRWSLNDATPQPASGLATGDTLIAWSRDSRAVYVQRGTEVPARIERVDLATGARTIEREINPAGLGSVVMLAVADWVEDGRWFAYNVTTIPSTLFVVTGPIN